MNAPDPEEQTRNMWDQQGWNDCGVPVGDPPRNPFVYEGAIHAAGDVQRKNVVLFGETGAGKSSVINLMAGKEVAPTSSDLQGCTLQSTEYAFTLSDKKHIRVYDTVGLNEPKMEVNAFLGAIEKAYKLVTFLHDAGGIDLLLFCIRGSRVTSTMQCNYRLFFEFLCGENVPLAFVVTNLEHEAVMENWWKRNEGTFGSYGMWSVGHACITATPARVTAHQAKRAESRTILHKTLQDSLSVPRPSYLRDVGGWFARLVSMLRSLLLKTFPTFYKINLSRRLETRCALPRSEARRLADILASRGESAQ